MLAPSLVYARVAHVYVSITTAATVERDFDPHLSIHSPRCRAIQRDEFGKAGQRIREFKRHTTCEVHIGMHVTYIHSTVKRTHAISRIIYLEILLSRFQASYT